MNKRVKAAVTKVERGLTKAHPHMKTIGRGMNFASGLGLIAFGALTIFITAIFGAPQSIEEVWQALSDFRVVVIAGSVIIVAGSLLFWFNRPWK